MGVLGDWENPYLSLNKSFEADTVRALGRIIANGHLEKGEKPVHFCMDCGSALAEAEVEYKDKKSHSIDVKFKVKPESIESLCNAFKTKKIKDSILLGQKVQIPFFNLKNEVVWGATSMILSEFKKILKGIT